LTEKFGTEKETSIIITKMAKADFPISEIISRRWSAVALYIKKTNNKKIS
jgi:hypothetical protein